MSGMKIREATREDVPAMLALYAQPGYDDGVHLPAADATRIFDKTALYPFYKFFVTECDGEIVATYAILVMDNIGHMGAPSAVVESVAVNPFHQGAGVGKRMMDHAMVVAREHGCYKLALSSNAKRERAHAFYEKLGYRRHGYSFGVDLEEASQ